VRAVAETNARLSVRARDAALAITLDDRNVRAAYGTFSARRGK
jgi:hypothetical protein